MTDAKKWTLSSLHKASYGVNHNERLPDPSRCCVEVVETGSRWVHYKQCARRRGYGPDEAYCKQHSPQAVDARRAETAKNMAAAWRQRSIEGRANIFYRALKQIRDGHNDPSALAAEVLRGLDDDQ